MKTLARLTGCALAFGALLATAPAKAQDFSGKPIRMIVGLAAGGATDVMARLIAAKMSEGLKTPVIVENKAGGNFIPAIRELTAQPADGHTPVSYTHLTLPTILRV